MATPAVEDDCRLRFNDWRVKQRDVEKKRSKLETREREIVRLYGNILLMVHVHACFFIVCTSCLVGLFKEPIATYWMYGIILTVMLLFIIEVIRPVLSSRKELLGLKSDVEELIAKRKKIHGSCLSLLDSYVGIYLFASQNKGHGDSFLKELRKHDIDIDILEGFKSQDYALKTRKKYYTIYPGTIGISCLMYTITLLLFALSKSDTQLVFLPAPPTVPGTTPTVQGPPAPPPPEHILSLTIQGSLKSSRRSLVSPLQMVEPFKKLTTKIEVSPTVAATKDAIKHATMNKQKPYAI